MQAPEQPGKIFQKVADTDVLYMCSTEALATNNWKDVYKKWKTTDFGDCEGITRTFQRWRDIVPDKVLPNLPLPSLSTVPVKTEAEGNLKRRRSGAKRNDVLPIQKKVKHDIIIIDD